MSGLPERTIANLALTGFMGTGKTTVGHLVAHQLQFDFLDTDHLLERRAGKSVARVFAEDGEAAFRLLERDLVNELAGFQRTVIATGGGLGANPELLASLRRHAFVVCLWASPDAIWQRIRHATHRPLLQVEDPLARIRELLAQRGPVYRQADVMVCTARRNSREIARLVVHHFEANRNPRTRPPSP